MLVKLLGVIDIIGAFIALFGLHSPKFLIIFPIIILIKGIAFGFMGDPFSFLDVFCAVVIMLLMAGIVLKALAIITVFLLGFKGLISLFA
jgi:hypothetical protein